MYRLMWKHAHVLDISGFLFVVYLLESGFAKKVILMVRLGC